MLIALRVSRGKFLGHHRNFPCVMKIIRASSENFVISNSEIRHRDDFCTVRNFTGHVFPSCFLC